MDAIDDVVNDETIVDEGSNDVVVTELSNNDLMLTTKDNPYNPKEDYPKWRRWDIDNGYNTEEYLDRLSNITDVDDEMLVNQMTDLAINQILEHDVLEIYTLI